MRTLDQLIEQAMCHVDRGRRIVLRQRQVVEENAAAPGAIELLGQFERSQEIFESDLARLLKERDKRQCRRTFLL